MALVIIKRKSDNKYKGTYYTEGYYYSSYTHAEGGSEDYFGDLKEFVQGHTSDTKISIFEKKEDAEAYLMTHHLRDKHEYEVVELFKAVQEEGL